MNDENLSPPWQPGQSGNPSGKPVGIKNRATIIKELLALANKEGVNNEYAMNQAMLDKACSGDMVAIKEIQDTVYGKVPDKIETKQEHQVKSVKDKALSLLTDEQLTTLMESDVTNGLDHNP